MVKCGLSCPQSLAAKGTVCTVFKLACMAGFPSPRGPMCMCWVFSPPRSTCSVSNLLRLHPLWVSSGKVSTYSHGQVGFSGFHPWATILHLTQGRIRIHSHCFTTANIPQSNRSGITNLHPHKDDSLDKDSRSLIESLVKESHQRSQFLFSILITYLFIFGFSGSSLLCSGFLQFL